jgi:hypothetical protein
MATNYIIAGNIDFYKELYESLDKEDDVNPNNDSTNSAVCLITNAPLENNFITLDCNHRFNYKAIFNDVLTHKKKFNVMERRSLKIKEIRCPFCRNIQNNLLPYYENMGVKKVHGVNYLDETRMNENLTYQKTTSQWVSGVCAYEETLTNTTNIVIKKCSKKTVKILPETGKTYCSCHIYDALTQHIKDKKAKEQEKKKEEKLLLKQKAKEEKLLLKQKAKEEKNALILEKKNSEPLCIQILKTGKNKGQPCGCKAIQDNLCSRHAPKNKI